MKGFICLCVLLISTIGIAQTVDMSQFKGMSMRSIGPAGMSGRVTCIDVVESKPNTIYIGTASGGVWRSTSGGTSWEAISDTLATINIGALTIQQSNPSVIWAGTGEGNPRNSQSSGFGLYKTIDGGRSWKLVGLEQTRNIHKILIHPIDPNTIWVGAQGQAWGDNPNRGVFKTTDGGITWKHVLKGDISVGIADLVLDPNNPNKLIACMWDFRREPWSFRSGGSGSGMYLSNDSGENWDRLSEKEGLPKGDLGRIGIAIAPSNSDRIYALIEAKKNQLYRSDDGGYNWKVISSDKNAGNRPFYYSDLFVDPMNENRVYSLWSRVSMSEDGGKTWKITMPYYGVHPDFHAFWVHPKDPNYVIVGNDGGLAISRDRAKTWRKVKNLPLGQFYHINIDNELPYNVYGGMQDNGSWRGPAYVWAYRGLRNANFQMIQGGDGFDVVPDPENSNRYGYSMSQGGALNRYDLETGYSKGIKPTTNDTIPLRFNWNAALAIDTKNPNIIYYGSQFVHKSINKGDSWERLSPDLTTNDTTKQQQDKSGGLTLDVTGAENYTSITCISPSELNNEIIWVGTDDGRLSLTKDGGKSWVFLEDKLKGMPKGAWIPQIHVSSINEKEVFVVVNDYRRNDWKPYLFHSNDLGKSWNRIANEDDFPGYCLSLVQDTKEDDLLFLGTENGLYISFDKGTNWNHWKNKFPNVSTMDLKIQKRDDDLVIGTFGRSVYILDNISPLRVYSKIGEDNWSKDSLIMFQIPIAYQVKQKSPQGLLFAADATYTGENRTSSARLYVKFKSINKDTIVKGKMLVYNSNGDTIRTKKIKLNDGMNYLVWGLDAKGVRYPNKPKPKVASKEFGGRPVLPGNYTIEVKIKGDSAKQSVLVKADPKLNITMADLKLQQQRLDQVFELISELTAICDEFRAQQKTIKKINSLMPTIKDSTLKAIVKLGNEIEKDIKNYLDLINGQQNIKGLFSDKKTIISTVQKPLWTSWGTLTGNEQAFTNYYNAAVKSIEPIVKEVNTFNNDKWINYKKQVENIDLDPFAK